jgi:hypothetical protein
MDDNPRNVASLDDDETAEKPAVSGPLAALVEREIGPGTVETDDFSVHSSVPSERKTAPAEYAEGTTEHDDDREG